MKNAEDISNKLMKAMAKIIASDLKTERDETGYSNVNWIGYHMDCPNEFTQISLQNYWIW